MSRCILRRVQNSVLSYVTPTVQCAIARRYGTGDDNNTSKSTLGHTSILVQQGSDIQELPAIFRKIKKDEIATILSRDAGIEPDLCAAVEVSTRPQEVIEHLDNCLTSTGILSIINQIPEKDLCPEIAAYAFDRLVRNETLIGLKNLENSSAVFDKIIECILRNGDPKMLLDFMELLKKFLDLQKTVQRFCDELLVRNSDGILTVVEICECIERFVDCKQQEAAEKFWTGIADNEKLIDDQNIKFIFKVLPKLKVSRRLVLGVIEREIPHLWWNMTPEAVSECLEALSACNSSPFRTMHSFSRWLNTNIHAVSEAQLEGIVGAFTTLDFSNNQIEKALERYMKAKGIRVKSQSLIATILSHCMRFRIRNHHILNGSSEYVIANADRLDPSLVTSMIEPFGYFHYQPVNSIKFWQTVETYLKDNFTKIQPMELIKVFLSCCYIQMFPLNFVSSVFNPYFLDLMHSTTPTQGLSKVRSDLKLIDASLTLECQTYTGPLLPRDHVAKSIWQDGRIKRVIHGIIEHLEELAGGYENLTTSVIVGKLPVNSLYIIDALIHPPGIGNFWSYSVRSDRNVYVAVLVHLPEYFDSTGEFLIGPQMMRIRHLRCLGIKVVTLNYDKLMKLRIHPKMLKAYLVERMKNALDALPYEVSG